MMFRMVAGLRFSRSRRATVLDATGSPVSMYVCTIECRIARCRVWEAVCRFIAVETTLSITYILGIKRHVKQGRLASALDTWNGAKQSSQALRLYLLKYGFIPVEVAPPCSH